MHMSTWKGGVVMNMNERPTLEEFKAFLVQEDNETHHILWLDESGEGHLTPVPDTLSPMAWELVGDNQIRFILGIFVRAVGPCGTQAPQDEECVRRLYEDLVRFWELHQRAPARVSGSEHLDRWS